ncbi:MAG TPA: hypothetical protein VIZ28_01685 [Chitinophagaceae bacterium]
MRSYLYCYLPIISFLLLAGRNERNNHTSPLAAFSAEWNNTRYLVCNTAANAGYLSKEEKDVVYILNLLRTNPVLFANTVLQKYPDHSNQGYLRNIDEYKSLMDTLRKLKPLPLLYPDSLCFVSARCHAVSSGQAGYVGHKRRTAECEDSQYYTGECCDYGHNQALAILMALLIDEGVPSLGHRFLCLNSFSKIGVSIQPHKSYGFTAVIDFIY